MSEQYSIFTRAELITMLKETNNELLKLQASESVKSDPVNQNMITKLTSKSEEIRSAISSAHRDPKPTASGHQDYKFIQLATFVSTAMKDDSNQEYPRRISLPHSEMCTTSWCNRNSLAIHG